MTKQDFFNIENMRSIDAYNEGYKLGLINEGEKFLEIFKQWLKDNSKITYEEENREMLSKLLKAFEEEINHD